MKHRIFVLSLLALSVSAFADDSEQKTREDAALAADADGRAEHMVVGGISYRKYVDASGEVTLFSDDAEVSKRGVRFFTEYKEELSKEKMFNAGFVLGFARIGESAFRRYEKNGQTGYFGELYDGSPTNSINDSMRIDIEGIFRVPGYKALSLNGALMAGVSASPDMQGWIAHEAPPGSDWPYVYEYPGERRSFGGKLVSNGNASYSYGAEHDVLAMGLGEGNLLALAAGVYRAHQVIDHYAGMKYEGSTFLDETGVSARVRWLKDSPEKDSKYAPVQMRFRATRNSFDVAVGIFVSFGRNKR